MHPMPRATAPRFLRLRRSMVWLLGLYAVLMVLLVVLEPYLVYQPRNGTADPAIAGLPQFTAQSLAVPGLPAITYWENDRPASPLTVFYFHGNGGGLYLHTTALHFLDQAGLKVVAMEYPGYPGAEGKPSEPVIIAQAVALWDAKAAGRTDQRAVIWGFSLGSGVATQLAAKRTAGAVVLEAPFTSVVDRGAELNPLIPVRYLMRNTYRSRDAIGSIHAPLFIMHGDRDRIIPIHHGRALFAAAHEPKTMREYPGFGHLNLANSTAYADALAFMRASVAGGL
jgi:uncharacterized protein